MPLIFWSWKIGFKMCIEFVQNSQKWCSEFASYAHRIFNFSAQNCDNPTINHCMQEWLIGCYIAAFLTSVSKNIGALCVCWQWCSLVLLQYAIFRILLLSLYLLLNGLVSCRFDLSCICTFQFSNLVWQLMVVFYKIIHCLLACWSLV